MAASKPKTAERAKWSGKWTFVISAAASAVGLGNLWRFPYLAAQYGGGTFLIMNLLFTLTFGVSLLILEISFGRNRGVSAINAFESLGKRYKWVGILVTIVPLLILPYYCVIGGWVVKFIIAFSSQSTEVIASDSYFTTFQTTEWQSFLYMIIFMLVTFAICFRGVKGGIEKANLVMMPALLLIAAGLAIYIASFPSALPGIVYFLSFDFSKLNPDLIMSALGQTFFTLSLAMGIMITYGSYLKKDSSITHSAFQISGCAFAVSVLAGLIIVPAAFLAFGGAPTSAGPSLMFVTLPKIFNTMGDAGKFVGLIFFVLVLFAALTSSISIAETCVASICDTFKIERKKVLFSLLIYAIFAGAVVNAGYNCISWVSILDKNLLEFIDWITNSLFMPVAAIATCVVIGWCVKPNFLIKEIKFSTKLRWQTFWVFMIKYVCPIAVFIILISNIVTAFV